MLKEKLQEDFIKQLRKLGINTSKELLFYPDSKRLTRTGNIYASMNNILGEGNVYTLNINFSQENKKILEDNIDRYYYVEVLRINSDEGIKITVYDETFDIRIQLLGGIDSWWEKVKGEYYA